MRKVGWVVALLGAGACVGAEPGPGPQEGAAALGSGASLPEPHKASALGGPPTSEWTLMGYDEASTYNNRAETKLTKDNVGQLEVAWRAELGGALYGAPLQVADKIYVAGPRDVRAFDAISGDELWKLDQLSTSTLAYVEGSLYLNTSNSKVIAIDADTGEVKWRRGADEQPVDGYSSVIAAGDRLFVGGSNGGAELSGGRFLGFMAALDRESGDSLWTSYTVSEPASGAGIFSSPSIDSVARRVYGTTANNFGPPATDTSDAFIAFDMDSGGILWRYQAIANDLFPGNPDSPDFNFGANPVLYETDVDGTTTRVVVAGNKSGDIFALRRDDGTLLWTRKLGKGSADAVDGILNNTTWSGKHVLVACNERGPSTLYALDPATGDIAWQRRLKGSVWGRISVANGVGFVGNDDVLEAFDTETGALIASYPSPRGTLAGIITIADGRVAFGDGLDWATAKPGSTLTVLRLP